jgi:SPOR domain
MKNFIAVIIVLFLGLEQIKAQNVVINEEPIISRMMETYVTGGKSTTSPTTNNTVQVIDGFRIQLMATTDRLKVDEAQSTFNSRYPGVYTGWSQAKPYYRVRIGGFSSRTEASNFLQKIKKDYPDAYIVPDRVKTSEISAN